MCADCREWGDGYPSSFAQCSDGYICGLQEKFEISGFADDETGLNAVQFKCCDFTHSPTRAPTAQPTAMPTAMPTQEPTSGPVPAEAEGASEADAAKRTGDGQEAVHWSVVLMACVLSIVCVASVFAFVWFRSKLKRQRQIGDANAGGSSPINLPVMAEGATTTQMDATDARAPPNVTAGGGVVALAEDDEDLLPQGIEEDDDVDRI